MKEDVQELVIDVARVHTSVNVFAIVKAVLESGALHGATEQSAAMHICKLCDQAMQRQLKVYDKEMATILKVVKK